MIYIGVTIVQNGLLSLVLMKPQKLTLVYGFSRDSKSSIRIVPSLLE